MKIKLEIVKKGGVKEEGKSLFGRASVIIDS